MRVLGSVVAPSTALMSVRDAEIAGSGAVRPQVIRDQPNEHEAVLLQELVHELQRGVLVPFRLNQHIEDLSFGVDGAPQVNHPAVDS